MVQTFDEDVEEEDPEAEGEFVQEEAPDHFKLALEKSLVEKGEVIVKLREKVYSAL